MLPRRVAVDLSNRKERSTHSLERLQSLREGNARYKIPLCRLLTLYFVFFQSLIVPSLHLVQSLSLFFLCLVRSAFSRVFEPPSTSRGLRLPRATDWLTEQRARGRRERTSNSSVPNLTEWGRTWPSTTRPTIACAPLSRAFLAKLPTILVHWHPLRSRYIPVGHSNDYLQKLPLPFRRYSIPWKPPTTNFRRNNFEKVASTVDLLRTFACFWGSVKSPVTRLRDFFERHSRREVTTRVRDKGKGTSSVVCGGFIRVVYLESPLYDWSERTTRDEFVQAVDATY